MASACVNSVGMSPDNFLDCPPAKFPSYAWLSPRIPFSREISEEEVGKTSEKDRERTDNADSEKQDDSDPDFSGVDFVDFEFRLEDPVIMLPADELFADGKLVPLQLSASKQPMKIAPAPSEILLPDTPVFRLRNEISPADPFLFSPKAPRCSSRWKELLGLRKLYQNSMTKQEDQKTAVSLSSNHTNRNAARSLKQFLQRNTKPSANSSIDSSLNIPLLKEIDNESSVSISSRISLSSSSSGHEHDDLPRLSLDSDKPRVTRNTHQLTRNISRVRVVKPKGLSSENNPTSTRISRHVTRRAPEPPTVQVSGVAADSPRMNSSGKIVFHSLERSSSSPSSFNGGGSRYKHRGMERSYSANVRVTPVLNVPVCSLRGSSKSGVFGFPMFSSQLKRESSSCNGTVNKNHNKNRMDRT